MRRSALVGLALLLSGCNGYPHFLSDTSGYQLKRNAPIGDAENMRRARGQDVDIPPLRTEPGNVWPGPAKPEPTLSDLQREQNSATPPAMEPTPPAAPHPQPRGSSTPPGNAAPGLPPELTLPTAPGVPGAPARVPGSRPQTFITPGGPVLGTQTQGGYQTLTKPGGGNGGIAIPNGNGTSTIIAPDGGVTTVPTPR